MGVVRLVGLVGLLLSGCDRESSPVPEPPPATAPRRHLSPEALLAKADAEADSGALALALARARALDAPIDPAGAPGDLRADIDTFTTLDDCILRHAVVDPVVRDTMEAIGFDTLAADSCRILAAAKALDPRACGAIELSALRDACTATVAEVAGRPDACPWVVPGRPATGRDPVCVAFASHDARMCRAASRDATRTTCAAMIAHDPSTCSRLGRRSEEERCERSARRWARIGVVPRTTAAGVEPEGRMHVAPLDADASARAVDVDLALRAREGVVVREGLDGATLVFGDLPRGGPDRLAVGPQEQGGLAFELRIPGGAGPGGGTRDAPPPPPAGGRKPDGPAGATARVTRAEVRVPGHLPLSLPEERGSLAANLTQGEHTRGAPLVVDLTGEIDDATGRWSVRAHVSTYVRDVVHPAEGLGLEAPVALDGGDRSP